MMIIGINHYQIKLTMLRKHMNLRHIMIRVIRALIDIVIWIVILFVVFPLLFGIVPNAWLKLFILIIWAITLIGKLSYILIHGIQGDIERVKQGRDIITGDKYEE